MSRIREKKSPVIDFFAYFLLYGSNSLASVVVLAMLRTFVVLGNNEAIIKNSQ